MSDKNEKYYDAITLEFYEMIEYSVERTKEAAKEQEIEILSDDYELFRACMYEELEFLEKDILELYKEKENNNA
ncbi:MAG: hypothetical protein K2H01_11075 [Ruminococcus sp.]|nr:hypothetical protein [Ruminococcus sp.]